MDVAWEDEKSEDARAVLEWFVKLFLGADVFVSFRSLFLFRETRIF